MSKKWVMVDRLKTDRPKIGLFSNNESFLVKTNQVSKIQLTKNLANLTFPSKSHGWSIKNEMSRIKNNS